ncbi:MAG: tetratricopeptide repeat protein [Nitrospirae bacterium]|nr:tetratricopeptide repeat protein [Nitrospirota bacterium]
MSIILKALKKAEETKSPKEIVKKVHTFQLDDKRKTWVIILAVFAVTVLLFSIGIYKFKGKPVLKPPVRVEQKYKTGQEKKEDTAAELPDAARFHEDAIKLIKEKNYAAAENILKKALIIKPDDAVMHNHLGLALKNQLRYKEASVVYDKAIRLKPDYYEAMNNLAVTEELVGNTEKAKSLYKKALSIKPSYAEAHLNYALLLETEGDISEAESHYHTFLNLSSAEALKTKVKERLRELGQ